MYVHTKAEGSLLDLSLARHRLPTACEIPNLLDLMKPEDTAHRSRTHMLDSR